MPRWLQGLIHMALGIGGVVLVHQYPNEASQIVGAIAAGQASLGLVSQNYNTDGTPQEVAKPKN